MFVRAGWGLGEVAGGVAGGPLGGGRWAEDDGEDHVRLPLGLIALNWLRFYLPLTAANLPQAPGNLEAAQSLGFAGPGWTALAAGAASQRDLRVGAVFGGASAVAVHAALREPPTSCAECRPLI